MTNHKNAKTIRSPLLSPEPGPERLPHIPDPSTVALEKAIRQFVFDIVMGELGMDDADADDQADATERVDAWMEHWRKTGARSISADMPEALRWIVPEVGSVWEWEPLSPHARQTVTVTEVRWNGEEVWVESESIDGRHWNTLGRWIEATVLVKPMNL